MINKKILIDVPENTNWNRDETVAIVFDENGKQIADYDLVTGISIENVDGNLFMTIDEECVPKGTMLFKASWAEFRDQLPAVIGLKEEVIIIQDEKTKDVRVPKRPWDYKNSGIKFVSFKERSDRISICRSCPLFDHETGICEINGLDMIYETKNSNGFCPDGLWGIAENADPNYNPQPSGQDKFELDLEKYLEGLQ